ncbi:MAG: PhzF family phenazine biosynthesis protein [Gammaproteobacteria bacterium]|nr:MAG: PhzF family phenazine biosynthesis protein [Gammaproteobacteria bacterium]
MNIPFFQVDAFANKAFIGNPAAVCMLEEWLPAEIMQKIAAENNLSETAFLVKKAAGKYDLRWFTPEIEVDLCGHATLAAAYVIFECFNDVSDSLSFETASGTLVVNKEKSDKKNGELLSMDFPARKPEPVESNDLIVKAFGIEPIEVLKSRDLFVVFEDEKAVRDIKPDFDAIKQIKDSLAVIVTAKGDEVDFVSRFFAPNAGIDEDPVTGSAHCTLIPYWAEQLGKNEMHALQVSNRGGELFCEHIGDRVKMAGKCALYAKGEIYFD